MSEQKLSIQELLEQYTVEELDKILSVFGKCVESREHINIPGVLIYDTTRNTQPATITISNIDSNNSFRQYVMTRRLNSEKKFILCL